jgi:hypothetical protein
MIRRESPRIGGCQPIFAVKLRRMCTRSAPDLLGDELDHIEPAFADARSTGRQARALFVKREIASFEYTPLKEVDESIVAGVGRATNPVAHNDDAIAIVDGGKHSGKDTNIRLGAGYD